MRRPTGEAVLMYGFNDPQRMREISYIMMQMGIRIKVIKEEQLGQTVGYLAGVKGMEENAEPKLYEPLGEEVLVMCNFLSDKRIDQMLSNIKKRGLAWIPLKCILTRSNAAWTFHDLAKELEREHAVLTGKAKAGNTEVDADIGKESSEAEAGSERGNSEVEVEKESFETEAESEKKNTEEAIK